MAIYRGDGGSGDASTDAYASQVAQDANTASTKADEAAASATAAASSASAAAASESNASTSETNAASSESSAATSASNASTSETNAASSASSASTSASNAATSETNAATSETNAASSATNAATSASTATTQASAASSSATAAASSASAAATSETNAATSETNASTSETNAASSATSAAASYDSFDDRYLGTKASDPSTDNDGDSLVTGALYFNTTDGEMRVYNGSSWLAAYLPGTTYLQLSGGTMTGALTLNADPSTNLQAATKQYVDTIAAASLHYHDPVRVEKEGNLNATYNNGTAGVGATLTNNNTQAALVIDGVTLSLNDRVLIYEQTNAFENGIYTVTDTGSVSTNWVLTRATDADSYSPSDPDSLGEGDAFFVLEGALGAGELYVMNTSGAITFGTTAIDFVQVSSAQVYTGGTGITISGSEISTTALLNVVEDTTPQLGGALSANGFNINMGTNTITDTKVGQWDTAYGWGDHSAAGYLTSYTETDPTVPAHVKSITTTEKANWNTAYGWGDHSTQNYAVTTGDTFTGSLKTQDGLVIEQLGDNTDFLKFEHSSRANSHHITLSGVNNEQLRFKRVLDAGGEDTYYIGGQPSHTFYTGTTGSMSETLSITTAGLSLTGTLNFDTGSVDSTAGDVSKIRLYDLSSSRYGIGVSSSQLDYRAGSSGSHVWYNGPTTSAAVERMRLDASGNLTATGNVTAYSDERLKSDVETLDGSKVYDMRGVSFTKDGEDGSGVIAQELQKVAPELVNDSGKYLSVAYGNLVGYLIEAVKDLKAEIEELKNGSSD